jgi:two-component system, NarL family, sensor kinase
MEISKTLTLYFGVITGMIAFVIIAVGSIIIAIRYQKRLLQKQAELHKIDLDHKEALLISNIQSVEEERRRIAKDIHDELGGIFSTLFITMNQLKTGDTQNAEIIYTGKELINTGIKSVRRIAHSIIPDELELFGLNIALENYLNPLKTAISLDYQNTLEEGLLSSNEEIAVYRIIQELVSNTMKHAAASALSIVLEPNNDGILITYHDNGKGYDPNHEIKKNGLGTKNIESRIIAMNAALKINTSAGNGFTCVIEIPLPKK